MFGGRPLSMGRIITNAVCILTPPLQSGFGCGDAWAEGKTQTHEKKNKQTPFSSRPHSKGLPVFRLHPPCPLIMICLQSVIGYHPGPRRTMQPAHRASYVSTHDLCRSAIYLCALALPYYRP